MRGHEHGEVQVDFATVWCGRKTFSAKTRSFAKPQNQKTNSALSENDAAEKSLKI